MLGAVVPFVHFLSLSDFHWMQNWNFLVVTEEVNAVLPAWIFSGREKDTPCLCSDEHFEKPCSEHAEHRPWESTTWCLCCCWYLFSPSLSFRVTTIWSAVLHRSRWTCDESHGYGFPRPAQLPTRKPSLPTPAFLLQHTTSPLWAGGEILHVRTLALWPDCVRRRCNCKMTKMEGTCPSEHLLVLQVLSPSLPCTFPY